MFNFNEIKIHSIDSNDNFLDSKVLSSISIILDRHLKSKLYQNLFSFNMFNLIIIVKLNIWYLPTHELFHSIQNEQKSKLNMW